MLDTYSGVPLLLSFMSAKCGPCRLQKKELEKFTTYCHQQPNTGTSNRETLPQLIAIDTDKWPRVGSKFNVGKLPCLILLTNGQERLKVEGLVTAEYMIAKLHNFTNNIDI